MGKQRGVFGKLENKSIRVTPAGITIIENHLTNVFFQDESGNIYPQNRAMIDRLKQAMKAGRRVKGADASFYMHEISEATKMRRKPYIEEVYIRAHQSALGKYQVSPFSLYHPDVIAAYPQYFNRNWRRFWEME